MLDSAKDLNDLRVPHGTGTALRLARYFGNSPEFWQNLQAAHDLRTAERDAAARIEREMSPRQAA